MKILILIAEDSLTQALRLQNDLKKNDFAVMHATFNRRQILNPLLSMYETAVKTNHDLRKAHEQLNAAPAQSIDAEKFFRIL